MHVVLLRSDSLSETPPTNDSREPAADAPEATDPGPDMQSDAVRECLRRYWRSNICIMAVLLTIWAIVGLGCGVLFADALNKAGNIGGYPMGFWFAQQGSIIVFVLLILIYCILLNRLDAKHHKELEQLKKNGGQSA